jgi:hypothetical protein
MKSKLANFANASDSGRCRALNNSIDPVDQLLGEGSSFRCSDAARELLAIFYAQHQRIDVER